MPKWIAIAASAFLAAAVVVAAVVYVSRSDESASQPTVTTAVVPQVAGTIVSTPPTTTVPAPTTTVAPAPVTPAAPTRQIVTVTPVVPVTPTTVAPTTTTTRVPAASGATSVSIIDAPKVAGAPMDVIVRSVAEAQAALGTVNVPAWVVQFPFGQSALVLSTVAPSNDRSNCFVLEERWSRFGSVMTLQQAIGCLGGTDFSPLPRPGPNPLERRVAAFGLPLSTVAGVTTLVRA